MDDQFDNDLKNRIREVFENFEEPSADEGWLQLRKKFPEEQSNRRAFAWIWWAAAAILFLFLAIGVWMYSKNDRLEKFTVKTSKHTPTENLSAAKNPPVTSTKTIPVHTTNQPKNIAGIKDNTAVTRSNPLKISNRLKNNPSVNTIASLSLNDTIGKKTYLAKTADSAKVAVNQSSSPNLAATGKANNSNTNPVIVKPKQPAKSINDMFANDHPIKDKKSDEKSEKVHFGVYAATYFNYARGSSNNANLGAGFTADIKISKNLKLVTGITIAQNSLNFTSGIPTITAQSSFAVLATPGLSGGPVAPSAANVQSVQSASFALNSPITVASDPAFRNYNANLVGLDIPLNLKYDFNPKKYDIYILAGLSSGTFINETYTYQYNYPALFSPSLQQIQDETSSKNFNSFYLAKTLNLAFGVGYPLGKNRIILEPFLKYPLDGLGSQNIRFGAGGVNLKFSFQSQNK